MVIRQDQGCERCGGDLRVVESYAAWERAGELDVVVSACAGCGETAETALPVAS